MKIKYKGKDYVIPKPFDQCFFGKDPTKLMTIHNRFSDETFTQSCMLPAFAVAIYDTVIEQNELKTGTYSTRVVNGFKRTSLMNIMSY